MTVSVLTAAFSYVSIGGTAPRSIPFPFIDPSHVVVKVDDVLQFLGTDYTISGTYPSATLTPVDAWSVGAVVRVNRRTSPLQQYQPVAGVPLKAASIGTELDRQAMRNIEQDVDIIDVQQRAVQVPVGQAAPMLDLTDIPSGTILEYRDGKLTAFDFSPFVGKFIVGRAGDGRFMPSNGLGGGDLALRADVAEAEGLALAGFNQGAPYIQTRNALEKLREYGASAKDFGATAEFDDDNTEPLLEVFSYFSETGGQWHMPPGRYKALEPIVVEGVKPQRVIGCGKRGVYPGAYNPATPSDLAVIVPVHAGRAAISLGGGFAENTIEFRGVALATLETGDMPEAAFGWETGSGFKRNYIVESCSIHGFKYAFLTYKTGGTNSEMGLLKVNDCTINRNEWIARTLDGTQWNGFSFTKNEAGQNGFLPGQGGIDIAGHVVHIVDNALEGMRDPIKVTGAYLGVNIQSNYFEANVGNALVHLQGVLGPYQVGPNAPLALDFGNLDHITLLTGCGPGLVVGPYWPSTVYKNAPAVIGNANGSGFNILNPNVNTDDYGFCRVDSFDLINATREPEFTAIERQIVFNTFREKSPATGEVMVAAEYETSGSGAIELDYAIAGTSGTWVVMCWPMKLTPDAGAATAPYITMNVNDSPAAAGSRDYVLDTFNLYQRQGEWALVTCAVKIGEPMTSIGLNLFPFGINPAAGRKCRYLRPIVYTTNSPNKIIPFHDDRWARTVTAPPDSGGFQAGDMLINRFGAGGQGHFICTGVGPLAWEFT